MMCVIVINIHVFIAIDIAMLKFSASFAFSTFNHATYNPCAWQVACWQL